MAEEERWTITVDDQGRSVALELMPETLSVHRGWREVEVVSAQAAERLAEACESAYGWFSGSGTARKNEVMYELRNALRIFRAGSSKEGQ